MTSQAELVIARRNTRAFIEADVILVEINRYVKIPSGTGGWTKSPTPLILPPQKFRLVPTSTRAGDQSRTTPDGSFNETREELVGYHNADLKKNDEFEYAGLLYKVTHVSPENLYRKSGWVIQRGPDGAV